MNDAAARRKGRPRQQETPPYNQCWGAAGICRRNRYRDRGHRRRHRAATSCPEGPASIFRRRRYITNTGMAHWQPLNRLPISGWFKMYSWNGSQNLNKSIINWLYYSYLLDFILLYYYSNSFVQLKKFERNEKSLCLKNGSEENPFIPFTIKIKSLNENRPSL